MTSQNRNETAALNGNRSVSPLDDKSLLQRLEEANRLLHEDKRSHTRILTRSGSFPTVNNLGEGGGSSRGSTSSLRVTNSGGEGGGGAEGGKTTLSFSPTPPSPTITSVSHHHHQPSPPSPLSHKQPSPPSPPSHPSPAGSSTSEGSCVKEKPRALTRSNDEVEAESDFDDEVEDGREADLGPSSVLLVDTDILTDEELAILLQQGHLDDVMGTTFDPGTMEAATDTGQSKPDTEESSRQLVPSNDDGTRSSAVSSAGSSSCFAESAFVPSSSELAAGSIGTLASGKVAAELEPSKSDVITSGGILPELPKGGETTPEDDVLAIGEIPSGQPKEEEEEEEEEDVTKATSKDGGDGEKMEERDLLSELKGMASSLVRWNRPRSESEVSPSKGSTVAITTSDRGGATLLARKRSQTMATIIREQSEGDEDEKLSAEQDLWHTWSQLLKNWEESFKKSHKLIKQLARQGIPEHLRAMAWQLLSNSQDPELKERYPSLITEVSPFERQIQRDLARTFPEHSFFKERDGLGQEALFNILKAYSIYDREVGYCQGSPFIAGLLLMQMPEEDAFCVLVKMMENYRLRDLFKPSMADLTLCFYQLERTVEEQFPQLHLHFQAVGFHTSMYASPWFLTMFASVLSLSVVFRVVDMFLFEGRDVIFKVGLALLEHSQEKLIQLDMEDMLKHFQKEMKVAHEADTNAIIHRASKMKLNQKKMKKWEKEFKERKEKKAVENSELVRLQAENTELYQRISALEKECASLADRLIQGQVTRAEEAEEMFILKKDLAKMKRKVATIEEERVQKRSSLEDRESAADVVGSKEDAAAGRETIPASETPGEGGEGGEGGEVKAAGTNEDHIETVCTETPLDQPLQSDTTATAADITDPPVSPLPESPSPRPSLPSTSSPSPTTPIPDTPSQISHSSSTHKKRKDSKRSKKAKLTSPPTSPGGKFSSAKKEKHHKFHKRWSIANHPTDLRLGDERDPEAMSPEMESPVSSLKERKKKKSLGSKASAIVDLTRQLALAKTNYAEASSNFEQKKMELKHALQREAFVVRELRAAKEFIAALEQKLNAVQMERYRCPHCSQQLATQQGSVQQQQPDNEEAVQGSDETCGGGCEDPPATAADLNSPEVLYSSLRAVWNSSPSSLPQPAAANDSPSSNPRNSLENSASPPDDNHCGT